MKLNLKYNDIKPTFFATGFSRDFFLFLDSDLDFSPRERSFSFCFSLVFFSEPEATALEVLGVLGPSLEVLGPPAKAAAMISRSRLLRSEYDVDFEGTPGVAFPLS
jgi:hypothetical protein